MTFAATFTMTSLEADFGANLTMSPITKQSHKNILSHPFLTARCLISIQFTIFFLCLVASPLTLTLGPVFFPQVKFNVLLARNYFFWTCNLSKVLIHHCKYPKPNFKSISSGFMILWSPTPYIAQNDLSWRPFFTRADTNSGTTYFLTPPLSVSACKNIR